MSRGGWGEDCAARVAFATCFVNIGVSLVADLTEAAAEEKSVLVDCCGATPYVVTFTCDFAICDDGIRCCTTLICGCCCCCHGCCCGGGCCCVCANMYVCEYVHTHIRHM